MKTTLFIICLIFCGHVYAQLIDANQRDEIFTRDPVRGKFHRLISDEGIAGQVLNITPQYYTIPDPSSYHLGTIIYSSTDGYWVQNDGVWERFSSAGSESEADIFDGDLFALFHPMILDVTDETIIGVDYYQFEFENWDDSESNYYGLRFRPGMPILRLMPDTEMTAYARLLPGYYIGSHRGFRVQLEAGETWSQKWQVLILATLDDMANPLLGLDLVPWRSLDAGYDNGDGFSLPNDPSTERMSTTALRMVR